MNDVPPLTLPVRLRIAREHADLTVHDMAQALGVSRNTIPRWEAGSHTPNLGMVKQWAAETGVSLAYLLGEEVAETIPATFERRRNAQPVRQRRGGSRVVTHLRTTEDPAGPVTRDKQARKQASWTFTLVAAA